jgi:aspartate/tyrosine/aromatic aminotransferase
MRRGRGNMRIFRQMMSFSKVLVVWGVRVGVLAVCKAKRKTGDNLGG